MKALLIAGVVGLYALAGVEAYHVFIDHALSVEYVCAGPGHYLPDPGPPPNVTERFHAAQDKIGMMPVHGRPFPMTPRPLPMPPLHGNVQH